MQTILKVEFKNVPQKSRVISNVEQRGAGISEKVANSARLNISLSHFPFDKHHYIFLCRPSRQFSEALGRARADSHSSGRLIVRSNFKFRMFGDNFLFLLLVFSQSKLPVLLGLERFEFFYRKSSFYSVAILKSNMAFHSYLKLSSI